ncbi:MAG: hypothetical protein IT531_16170 [Burkholderiales bacterium]|nr:hypothetical protein [Burkholderiales bacterium]
MAASPQPPSSAPPIGREDMALLAELKRLGDWTRAVLCTLARLGVALRNRSPSRARTILDALSVYPPYKAGQFLFDLMEWEDFMLDAPPPPLMPQVFEAMSFERIAAMLDGLRSTIDPAIEQPARGSLRASAAWSVPPDLPALDASRYLYEDVVLGLWDRAIAALDAAPVADESSAGASRAGAQPAPEPRAPRANRARKSPARARKSAARKSPDRGR